VALPDPTPGLVIGYAYLWRNEALRGLEEGRKDRPCVIVLSVQSIEGRTVVTVAPITHTPPDRSDHAIEIPVSTKARLGLDGQRSWIVASDLNRFVWPGVDLRPTQRGAQRYDYGLLPPNLYRDLRDKVLALARAGRAGVTPRDE
jgi:hypothetical protein